MDASMKDKLQQYALSAAWFNPDRPPETYTGGMVTVLRELADADPEIAAGGWSHGERKVTTSESLAELIETRKVTGATYSDGSPILNQRFMVSSPGIPYIDPKQKDLGFFSFRRADDLPAQQSIDFILHHITFSTAVTLVRSIARHLQPDVVGADTREFGRALRRAQTVNIRATQLVGQISWIRGLSPEAVAGYPVTDVEEYAGGLFFLARSEQDAARLAALNDQLEREHTRRRLGLLPQFYDRDEV
ncbi:MAG: hypothetical protein Q4E05_10930 [Pseudoclavibacter sp.]|nr:hypothetical protein [Pseudoclavibacter sp.]